jgi:hypothetical protein
MVSVLVIVYEHSTCSDGATAKLVRQVLHKRIDARHPDSDASGALQIEAAGSSIVFELRADRKLTSQIADVWEFRRIAVECSGNTE